MVPVAWWAGMASARRMLGGKAASVAAAMPVVAVPLMKLRREFVVVMGCFSPASRGVAYVGWRGCGGRVRRRRFGLGGGVGLLGGGAGAGAGGIATAAAGQCASDDQCASRRRERKGGLASESSLSGWERAGASAETRPPGRREGGSAGASSDWCKPRRRPCRWRDFCHAFCRPSTPGEPGFWPARGVGVVGSRCCIRAARWGR